MLEAALRRKSGIFSRTSCKAEVVPAFNRFNGQKSRRRSTKGSVTNIGFAMSPRTKKRITRTYRFNRRLGTYETYAPIVSNQKKVLSTSLRSDTHATDSTCKGWSANNA